MKIFDRIQPFSLPNPGLFFPFQIFPPPRPRLKSFRRHSGRSRTILQRRIFHPSCRDTFAIHLVETDFPSILQTLIFHPSCRGRFSIHLVETDFQSILQRQILRFCSPFLFPGFPRRGAWLKVKKEVFFRFSVFCFFLCFSLLFFGRQPFLNTAWYHFYSTVTTYF